MADVDVSELEDLAALLVEAGVKADKISGERLREIATQLRDDAVAAAPVRTGDLAASIYMRGGKDFRRVGSDIRYAFFVEFGTSDTPPQPFLFPAARRAEDDLFREFERLADHTL
jgi:HK97 gp10 family phage protein